MRPILVSWRPKSEQGVMLAQELNAEYLYHDHARDLPNRSKERIVINWGCGDGIFPWNPARFKRVLNKPQAISNAVGKIETFTILKRKKFPTPEWTVSPQQALKWINQGGPVFARGTAEGNNGKGIKIFHLTRNPERVTLDSLFQYPLFTKGFPDYHTFRAFVFGGKVNRLYSVEHDDDYRGRPSTYIHNHRNGWVFYDANKTFLRPSILRGVGKAVSSLGLDFGAVDFGVTKDKKRWAIYEINSAFGGEYDDAVENAAALRKAFRGLK